MGCEGVRMENKEVGRNVKMCEGKRCAGGKCHAYRNANIPTPTKEIYPKSYVQYEYLARNRAPTRHPDLSQVSSIHYR